MNDEGFVEQFTQKLMTGKKVFVTDNYRKRLQEELLHVTKRLIFVPLIKSSDINKYTPVATSVCKLYIHCAVSEYGKLVLN